MYRLAEVKDLDEIMIIVHHTVNEMKDSYNPQWDEHYPLREDFLKDIRERTLYILEDREEIKGFIVLNQETPEEYDELDWHKGDYLVIHRLAVNPADRQGGYATQLIQFAEQSAVDQHITVIRSDTSSMNIGMNKIFQRLDYQLKGQINFHGKPFKFNCYEKLLNK
ncbi:GNAT family N-acetyltransferase [Macrococcus bovicus]|uniref:GNAT family N-acetyltransferase n=1 Tax=Macrococcus bovicus TaxID=69968 RepID=UPI0025A521D6|nr:GNAT family N-acetyltransferase [Macrococcus bovicus]WJP97836.1 GNAT family N-acetyltransferase [Macrococcus bovicus]